MNIANLQATLRHFAAERDWQPFHTPKNRATALMVEAAELAKVFQWMTRRSIDRCQLDLPRRSLQTIIPNSKDEAGGSRMTAPQSICIRNMSARGLATNNKLHAA